MKTLAEKELRASGRMETGPRVNCNRCGAKIFEGSPDWNTWPASGMCQNCMQIEQINDTLDEQRRYKLQVMEEKIDKWATILDFLVNQLLNTYSELSKVRKEMLRQINENL
jgi:hypothetical protein